MHQKIFTQWRAHWAGWCWPWPCWPDLLPAQDKKAEAAYEAAAGLFNLGLWEQGVRVSPARAPPEIAEWVIEPCCDDPFPDYDTEPVMMYANA